MPRRVLLAASVAALLAPTPAAAQNALERHTILDLHETGPADVQLDGDPAMERVAARRIDDFRFQPRIEDDCAGGTRLRRIGPVNDNVVVETVKVRGAAGPPLLFTIGSSGASGRVGDFRLFRLGPAMDTRGCPVLRTLFAFPSTAFPMPRPRRGTEAGSWSAQVRVASGRLAVRTFEGLYRRTDAGCCPSFRRTSDWRHDSGRDRFVRTRSRTSRIGR